MSLSVDDLRAFACVVEERSVTRAGQRLGVSQQAVSERIMRLERRLGVDLFRRLSHGMAPTAAAYRFLPYTLHATALLDRAIAVIHDDHLVRVGVHSPSAGVTVPFLEGVLSDFHLDVTEHPDTESVLRSVAEGSADLGIGTFAAGAASAALGSPVGGGVTPGPVPGGDDERSGGLAEVTVEVLYADPVVCVAAAGHPLVGQERVGLADLAQYGVVLASALIEGSSGQDVRVCARSTVAAELAAGRLVELTVPELPAWVVPISIAYRSTDSGYGPVQVLRSSAAAGSGETTSVGSPVGGVRGRTGGPSLSVVDPKFSRGVA